MVTAIFSCKEDKVAFYAANSDGIYFNYSNDNEFETSVNFAKYIVGDSTFLSVNVKLKTLGYLSEQDRKVILKAEPVESYELAQIEIPNIIVPAGKTEVNAIIKVLRPAEQQKKYAVRISIDGESSEGQIGEGIEEKASFTIYSEETYEEPSSWGNSPVYYFGDWNITKHRFLGKVTKNDTYDQYNWLEEYNIAAVDSIRRYYVENPEAEIIQEIDIPFVAPSWPSEDPNTPYSKPTYWGTLHDKYMGTYNGCTFARFAQENGVNTANEYYYFTNTEENMKEVNIKAVYTMSKVYNQLFQGANIPNTFRTTYSVPLIEDMLENYTYEDPDCWVDYTSQNKAVTNDSKDDGKEETSTSIYITDYYGDYSIEKYKFMIKTLLKTKGEKEFSLWYMFPVIHDFNGHLQWAEGNASINQMKECYDLFINEYKKAPEGTYNFTFPENVKFPEM